MSEYSPDRWLVLRITKDHECIYKVFACWRGGYTGSDHWQINSGIVRASCTGDVYEFDGHSGSVYRCHRDGYGSTAYGDGILHDMIRRAHESGVEVQVMPEDTDWLTLEYDPLAQWVQQGVAAR